MHKNSDFCGSQNTSIGQARHGVARTLQHAGFEAAQRDARLLIEIATGLRAEEVILQDSQPLTPAQIAVLTGAVARRLRHEPISRIRGTQMFYGREFQISPDVLDPRPETELLIDVVLDYVDAHGGRHAPWRLADVGTGSGCLIVTLLAELPHAVGVASDISPAALKVAGRNAELIGVAGRVRFVAGANLEPFADPVDVLVSNPPYIATEQIAQLSSAVQDFDPVLALDGGSDGLAMYRVLAAQLRPFVPSGLIALEVGAGQARAVADLLRTGLGSALRTLTMREDLGGHIRCVAVETQC